MAIKNNMPRGGKRKGAGRPKGRPTKRMTVPLSLVDRFKAIIKRWLKRN